MSKKPDFGTTSHKRQFQCRRCMKWKTKLFMVAQGICGLPSNLCLECDAHDRLKQEQFEKERKGNQTD